jgi:hypothetical protein
LLDGIDLLAKLIRGPDRKNLPMTTPIVFISHNIVKEGQIDEFRKHFRTNLPAVMSGKPGTFAQLAYENEDATQVTILRFFPSADALDLQLQGAVERSKRTYKFIETVRIEIYGKPNPTTLKKVRKIAGDRILVRVHPRFIGGFIRDRKPGRVSPGFARGKNHTSTSRISASG